MWGTGMIVKIFLPQLILCFPVSIAWEPLPPPPACATGVSPEPQLLLNTLCAGKEHLDAALARPASVPLVSVQNHNSCFDDPGLIGAMLTPRQLADRRGWSEAPFSSVGDPNPDLQDPHVFGPSRSFSQRY
jgi:hypothetical protein